MNRLRFAGWSISIGLGGIALWMLLGTSSPWVGTLAGYVLVFASAGILLDVIARVRWVPLIFPSWTRRHVIISAAFIGAVIVFLSRNHRPALTYVAWVLLLAAIYRLATICFFSAGAARLVRSLRRDFSDHASPSSRAPYGMIFPGPGGHRFLREALMEVERSLWRARRYSDPTDMTKQGVRHFERLIQEARIAEAEEKKKHDGKVPDLFAFRQSLKAAPSMMSLAFAEILGERALVVFLASDDVLRFPTDMRDYIYSNSSVCIAVFSSQQLKRFYGRAHDNEKRGEQLLEQLPGKVGSLVKEGIRLGNQALQEMIPRLHYCLGPSIILIPNALQSLVSDLKEIKGYDLIATQGNRPVAPVVSTLTARLSSCSLPLRQLDAELSEEQRRIIPQLARNGLPPLADAYLRFRLSNSQIERFLCLLDCIEVLIKYSVFVLIKQNGAKLSSLDDLKRRRQVPTLGIWRSWLDELARQPHSTDLGRRICDVCLSKSGMKVSSSALALTEQARNCGIECGHDEIWRVTHPTTEKNWFDWLHWLVDLRNVTKGHGGIDEKIAGQVLSSTHAAFIDLIGLLAPLTLSASLIRICKDGAEITLRGWLRGERRSSVLLETEHQSLTVDVMLRTHSENHSLRELTSVTGNSVLTWHSVGDNADTYVNYLTGWVGSLGQ